MSCKQVVCDGETRRNARSLYCFRFDLSSLLIYGRLISVYKRLAFARTRTFNA